MRKTTKTAVMMLLLGLCLPALSPFGSSISFFQVDAQGPYGTSTSPLFEGDIVPFKASVVNADVSDYYFRWDVNNDSIWEKDDFGAIKGDPTFNYRYPDDYVGPARVDAWDGVSFLEMTESRSVLNETSLSSFESPGTNEFKTVGMKFEVKHDLVVNQLGFYNDLLYPYITVYNIRLWTDSDILITSLPYPLMTLGNWSWLNIVPVTLFSGERYIVSVGIKGNLIPSDSNPNLTSDGYLEPLDFRYYDGSPFAPPSALHGSSVLPLVDIRYDFTYTVPDILSDHADVYVSNVAPAVSAGLDITGDVGEPVFFNGSFTDPGTGDTHEIEWNFGDNNATAGILSVNHTYFAAGMYIAVLTVIDDDGGLGWDNVVVNIRNKNTVREKIQILIDTITSMSLSDGIKNSLISKLKNAQEAHERGNLKTSINVLAAFIHHTSALEGKKISRLDSKFIEDSTLDIINQIKAGM